MDREWADLDMTFRGRVLAEEIADEQVLSALVG